VQARYGIDWRRRLLVQKLGSSATHDAARRDLLSAAAAA
jgi:hypothetical protein